MTKLKDNVISVLKTLGIIIGLGILISVTVEVHEFFSHKMCKIAKTLDFAETPRCKWLAMKDKIL